MKREHIVVMAAAVGLSFGSGVVAVAVGAGAAQAMPNSSGSDFIYPKGARISSIRKGCAPTRPVPISGAPACRCHAAPTAPVTRSIPTGT